MDLVREICSAGHSIRKGALRRARLPLRSLTVALPGASSRLSELSELMADELNVKEVRLSDDASALAEQVLAVVPAALGPRLGSRTQEVIAAVRRGDWDLSEAGRPRAAGLELLEGEFTLRLRPIDEKSSRVLSDGEAVVSLDIDTDDELESEGAARDLVRLVQQARRGAGLEVSDRMVLSIWAAPDAIAILDRWKDYVAAETLSVEMTLFELDETAVIPSSALSGTVGNDLAVALRVELRAPS